MPFTRIISALLLLAALALAQGIGSEQFNFNKMKVDPAEMQSELNTREDLLQALKTGNTAKVDSALLVLSYEKIPESAIDSLEILQINLIMGRYDLAVPQLANILMKKNKKVRYSFANDSLYNYLRNETQFAAHYTDKPVDVEQKARQLKVIEYMNEAMQAGIKQEYKDLAGILVDLAPYYEISDKGQWIYLSNAFKDISTDSLANIICVRTEERIYAILDFHQEIDTNATKPISEKIQAFCKKYPESEYSDWLSGETRNFDSHLDDYKRIRNYYTEKFYTGGLGIEVFPLGFSEGSLLFGVPVQISRLIVTPSMFVGGEFSDAFFITAGIDVYENKWLKVQPFVGGYDLFTAGMQVDFRFWMSKTPGEFNGATYMTLKLRYMGIYYAPDAATMGYNPSEEKPSVEKEWYNRFFIGIGVHFW